MINLEMTRNSDVCGKTSQRPDEPHRSSYRLLDVVSTALQICPLQRNKSSQERGLRDRYETLSSREQVVGEVARGQMKKQIAFTLGLSEITVKIHGGNGMKKLGVRSLADFVQLGDKLQLERQ